MTDRLAGALALLAEVSALRALGADAWGSALLWHACACLLLACRAGDAARSMVAGAIAGCLPIVGAAGVAWVLLPAWRNGRGRLPNILELEATLPVEAAAETARVTQLLCGSDGSLEQAASLLRALRALPASCAVPRWREALRDPREELRLLAHGLLTRREARAHVQLDRLQTLATPRERWAVLRVHAFACWELVCGERECSERALHALGDSARAALAIKPEAQLCVLLARAALRCGDGTGAAHWLQHAESLGIERERSAVLYAEAAFLAGDFAAVSRWLAQLRRRERRTDKVVKYWSSARNPSRVRPNHVA